MALATRCPHCRTTFRVAHDQLKLRAGMVRCGSCQQIFNGIENLVPADAAAIAAGPAAAKTASVPPTPVATPPAASAAPEHPAPVSMPPAAQPAHTTAQYLSSAAQDVAAETPVDPGPEIAPPINVQPEPEPKPETPVPETPEETQAEPVVSSDDLHFSIEEPALPAELHAQEETAEETEKKAEEELAEDVAIATAQEPAEEYVSPALETAEIAPDGIAPELPSESLAEPEESLSEPAAESEPEPAAAEAISAEDAADAAALEAQAELAAFLDEPDFVRRGRRKQRLGRIMRIGMAISIFFLLVGLVLQSAYTFRNVLAVAYPPSKPWLMQGCALIACQVGLPAQIDTLSIEPNDRALLTLDKDKTVFEFNVLIRNHSALPQAWPDIELTLNDGPGKAVVRRVFKARELPMPLQELAKGIAPNSEQSVKIFFRMTQLKASGYGVQIFYP